MKINILILLLLSFVLLQCKFDKILQPKSAKPGDVIEILLTISDNNVPEPNPHKGLLCILIPEDWSFVSGNYSGTVGSGNLELSNEWADSAETCYPANGFAGGMKWIALLSDSGYAYASPITIGVSVKLKVGETEGCYDLAYLVTKATRDLLCTSWTPLSYPHRIGIPDSCAIEQELKGESAPEWDDLFYRNSGWTGADGIYTIPLNGFEFQQDQFNGYTLMTFGDTFIGEVDANGKRQNSRLINNTYAIMQGNQPIEENINFFWDSDNGDPKTVFIPNTPESKSGDWYWPMDGLVIGDSIYVFGLRLDKNVEPFNLIGVNLISFAVNTDSGISKIHQKDTPLFYEPPNQSYEIVMGQAVMDMRETSGNPNADGYIYVFGPRSGALKKDMVAARVLPENINQFSEWEFWDGELWGSEIGECATITSLISQEFSVSPIDENLFLAVFQKGDQVVVRIGESPTGPFDIYKVIYDPPEDENNPNIFIYNAKGHPHLSRPGEMLISYNVNSTNFGDLFNDAGIYRPRFLTLSLENLTTVDKQPSGKLSETFTLFQNYPNPFNSSTAINFNLLTTSSIELNIYNILGQKIKTLISGNKSPGNYQYLWDGTNKFSRRVSSGIYLYQVKAKNIISSKKMILIN